MLEMIIKRKWYLQKHLDAPLLKERESYLEIVAQKGIVRSSLLSMADYLLLIVNMLPVTDEQPRKITIQEIKVAAELWSDTIKNHPMKRQHSPSSVTKFMNIAFSWLSRKRPRLCLYSSMSKIAFCLQKYVISANPPCPAPDYFRLAYHFYVFYRFPAAMSLKRRTVAPEIPPHDSP